MLFFTPHSRTLQSLWPFAGFVALLACGALRLYADTLLVVTSSFSAGRESAHVDALRLDTQTLSAISPAYALPGSGLLGVCANPKEIAVATTLPSWQCGQTGAPLTCMTVLDTGTFRALPFAGALSPTGWRRWVGAITQTGETSLAIVLGECLEGDEMGRGSMEAVSFEKTGSRHSQTVVRWRLPGTPVGAVVLDDTPRVAVLCRASTGEGATLLAGKIAPDAPRPDERPVTMPSGCIHVTPTALASKEGDAQSWVLLTGFSLDDTASEAVSWLFRIAPDTLESVGEPKLLQGTARATDRPLLVAGEGTVWTTAHMPGTSLTELTSFRNMQKTNAVVLRGEGPVHAAGQPDGNSVVAGLDNALVCWPETGNMTWRVEYPGTIGAVAWTRAGLFVGEGNRVHAVDPRTGQNLRTLQIQQGRIDALMPAATHKATKNKTKAGTKVKLVQWPEPLIFHGEAAGHEIRAWPFPEDLNPAGFSADYGHDDMPWLQVVREQRPGRRPAFYFFVDPAQCPPGQERSGTLTLSWKGASARGTVVPQTVPVRVLAAPDSVQRILWLIEPGAGTPMRNPDPEGYQRLGQWLARPPRYFAHQECATPFSGDLGAYTVVVLDAAAAAKGWVTRRALLDYVAGGGSLLFMGGALEKEAAETLRGWFAPMEVSVEYDGSVNGTFSQASLPVLEVPWKAFPVVKGSLLRASAALTVVPVGQGKEGNVFAAVRYGYGRAAFLASATPLRNAALETSAPREFASALFLWLSRARREYADMDGDRLPDSVEDRNNNGLAEPAETDYLRADTDGDGVPDGVEDANLNGVVDDGETDPRNPDSDGDRILDGADDTPCPVQGQRFLTNVLPPHGPAEGGYSVTLMGRNLTPGMTYLVGGRPVAAPKWIDRSQVEVRLPAGPPEGGPVEVRARTGDRDEELILPNGFTYLPKSRVGLQLVQAQALQFTGEGCTGKAGIELTIPEAARVQRLVLSLQAEPADRVSWGPMNAPAGTAGASPRLQRGGGGPGLLVTGVTGRNTPLNSGRVFEVEWRCEGAPPEAGIVLRVLKTSATTVENVTLPVDVTADTVTFLSAKKP